MPHFVFKLFAVKFYIDSVYIKIAVDFFVDFKICVVGRVSVDAAAGAVADITFALFVDNNFAVVNVSKEHNIGAGFSEKSFEA